MAFRLVEEEVQEEEPSASLGSQFKNAGALANRLGLRAGEAVVGLPGDILSTIYNLSESGRRKLGGKPGAYYEEGGGPLGVLTPPTSRQLRQKVAEKTEGRTEPQSRGEEFFSDFLQDAAVLAGGGAKQAAKLAGAGNLVAKGIEALGGGEGAQVGGKIGAMMVAGLIGGKPVRKYMSETYDKAQEAIKPGAKVDARPLQKHLGKMDKALAEGIETPSVQTVRPVISKLNRLIKQGDVSVASLWEQKKRINELLENKTLTRTARRELGNIKSEVNATLERYGKANPDFLSNLREADDIFAGLSQAGKLTKFINKIEPDFKSPYTWYLFSLAPGKFATGLGAKHAIKAAEALKRSPRLRAYYGRAMKAAAEGNQAAFGRAAKQLDAGLAESEELPESLPPSGRFRLVEE